MIKKLILITLAAAAVIAAPAKKQKQANVLDLKHSITDNAIVYPESFESDTRKLLEGWYMRNYTATDTRYAESDDAKVSDQEIEKRLKALPTVIEMPFNSVVRSYIDRYTAKSRPQVAAILGLSLYYMPIFEQELEAQGLPLELKYLPVIESGLDPNAVSKHGAAGLWQFMLSTAKGMGLEVNSLVDERRNPYAASKAAAAYLKELYESYGDWSLAIAAYNCGPGAVNKAIRRAGGDPKKQDFWSIYNYLSPETRGYVPMFIAANYVMNYYPDHNISPVLPTKPLVTDTLGISDRVHFNQISAVLSIPLDELRILNPQYRADIVPGTPEKICTLILPSQQVHAYLMSEDEILAFEADKYNVRSNVEPGEVPEDFLAAIDEDEEGADTILPLADIPAEKAEDSKGELHVVTHKVATGQTIADIAEMYDVSASDIRNWNHLRRNAVRPGQSLHIETRLAGTSQKPAPTVAQDTNRASDNSFAAAGQSRASRQPAAKKSSKKAKKPRAEKPKTTNHTIRQGETLSSISKKYGVSIDELRKANGMSGDNLRTGKNLKIPAKGTTGSKKKGKGKKKKRRR